MPMPSIIDRNNIVHTTVCAEMPTLDDSDHMPHGFSIPPRKEQLIYKLLSEENVVGIAIIETVPKLTSASLPTDSCHEKEKGADTFFPPLESSPLRHNIDPNIFWRNLCCTCSSVQLPTENVVIPTSYG